MADKLDPFSGESDESSVETTVLHDAPEQIPINDDDDDDDSSPAVTPEDDIRRPTRREKKANRYRELREEVETLRKKLEERPPPPPPQYYQPPPQPERQSQQDELSPDLQRVYDESARLTQEYYRLDEDQQRSRLGEFQKKAAILDAQKQRIVASEAAAAMSEVAERNAGMRMVRTQNADIFNWKHPSAPHNAPPTGGAIFESIWKRMVWAENRPDTPDTMNEALAETRKYLKLGKSPSPSDSLKSRLTGAPRGGATSKEAPKSFPMTKEYKRLARAAYPHLSEDKAFQRWVQTTGRKLLEDD